MATQRYISTSFWDDSWIHKLDPSEKLMFLYLMTNPLTNIAGIYKLSMERIVFDTGFNDHTVKHILEKFEKAGKVIVVDEYIIIPTWPKHQKTSSSTIRAGIDKILLEIPKKILFRARESKYLYPIDTLLVGYRYSTTYSDSDLNSDRDSDSSPTPPRFDEPSPVKPTIPPNDFAPDTPNTPTRYNHDANQINAFFAHWNSLGLPEFRRLLLNVPNAGELKEALSYYSADEITASIDAYHTAMTDPSYELGFSYATVVNFLIKGLETFAPGSKPLERYRKRGSEMSADEVAREAERISEVRRQGAAV